MASLAPLSHVPAWKKLGLKLKFAKETLDQLDHGDKKANGAIGDSRNEPENCAKKRKSEHMEEASAKKQKRESKSTKSHRLDLELPGEKNGVEVEKVVPAVAESTDAIDQKKREPKRSSRKLVTFSEDTKETDGAPEVELPEREQTLLTTEQRRAEKRRKREQRSKNRSIQESQPVRLATQSDRMLEYLSTYHSSRSKWKFQKNRETAILKHALLGDRIPASYNPALYDYLSSLKSVSAKSRVAQLAQEAIEADEKDNDDQDTEYKQAVISFRTQLAEWGNDIPKNESNGLPNSLSDAQLERLEKRRRAELVYFAVSGQTVRAAKSIPLSEQAKLGAKRKRKTRTAVVEDDTSSSSSSESESDSQTRAQNDAARSKKSSNTLVSPSSSDSDSDSDSSDSISSSMSDSGELPHFTSNLKGLLANETT
ncbi:hypothetical protein PRK78_000600 [Emydomyces testavorans]|uniref:WKF domain-containing protein n=1 Tax=Emydomyces testavorans TaxID=2070801 RepID=A0AAF0DB09_9EURO|nr:hypothetical protein PRK78_000600 [Emydomyces testavorans]